MRLVPSVHAGVRSTAIAMTAMRVNVSQYGLNTFDEMSTASASKKGLNIFDELGTMALVVGTACGGGFMALPHTTSPAGGLPSSLMLIATWAFLLLESLLMSDLVLESAVNPHELADGWAGVDSRTASARTPHLARGGGGSRMRPCRHLEGDGAPSAFSLLLGCVRA